MKYRLLGKTGIKVSEISLGTWQLGGKWGEGLNPDVARNTLEQATQLGINCFDTADVYQNQQSEIAIGSFSQAINDKPFVITKVGRQLNPHTADGYNEENLRAFINASRNRLNVDQLDMVLLHCPPSEVYDRPEVFSLMDQFKQEGMIKHYGVSIEKVEEGMKAMTYPGVEAIEIIYNMFRLKPEEVFLNTAKEKNVGVIVRVPLASGLLTGKYNLDTTFGKNDHRYYNRDGQAFDKGETFSGVDFQLGLKAVEALKSVFQTEDLAPIALKYILSHDAVSTVIPGASKPQHIVSNVKAIKLKDFSQSQKDAVKSIYEQYIKDSVHHLW